MKDPDPNAGSPQVPPVVAGPAASAASAASGTPDGPAASRAEPHVEMTSSLAEHRQPTETLDIRNEPPPPAPLSPAEPPLPAAFGRYAVKGVLGSGAYGTVYFGHDAELDRAVAIKVRRSDRHHHGDEVQRFLDEARRLARLRHPGIVAVHDVGTHHDQVYIVADFVEGTNLKDWLKQHRPNWQDTIRIVAAVADALAHAHSQRTVHRDVKPANIILGADAKPILVDFGLGLDEAEAAKEPLGLVAGTPAYMSPEQASGRGHRIDGRTDIFSLGVILYEMLTGRRPFHATTPQELQRQICEDDPQPPRQLVPHIPRALEKICLKALAKRIAARHSTAADFADELRGQLRDATVSYHEAQAPAAPSTACPGCGKSNPRSATFCSSCGTALSNPSPRPTAPAAVAIDDSGEVADSQAAPSGTQVSSSSRRLREAERRQLTLMACTCDLIEQNEFLENCDAEDQHQIIKDYQQTCLAALSRSGGTPFQITEQGFLACFGFPTAYEHAAHRAVRAGLEILTQVARLQERLRRERGISFAVNVCIHTGLVVVSEAAPGAAGEALSIVGDARNVINRLDSVARPDAVVMTEHTHRLVQGFFVNESLGHVAIKGVAKPLEFFRVIRASEPRNRVEVAVPAGLTPLIGRDREVGLLQDRWEQAVEGMGQIVLLIGDAGLGKSRLVYVLKEHVASAQAGPINPVVEWRCTPYHQSSSLYPVSDFIERQLEFGRDETPAAKHDKLDAYLKQFRMSGAEPRAAFAALLSLPADERYPALSVPPARQKELIQEAVLEWFRAYAAKQPMLFVVEDLHWIDPSTLELLALHVDRGFNDRILTLLTFRPEFETPWKSRAHQTVMALNRLTKRQITDMVQRKSGIKNLPPGLVDQLVRKTEGVPLFVEEYTKMVLEAGTLRETGGDVEISGSIVHNEIPATLQDLLMARLDRIASNREVVQIAASLGREFSYDMIGAVCPLDEGELQIELDKLVAAELLHAKGRPPHSSYGFKHALIQDAAYQSLLKSKRQQVHRRIAEVLEQSFSDVAKMQPEVLAHHFSEAGLKDQAIAYWLKAGLRSSDRSAYAEASEHLRRGLELVQTLPEVNRHRTELEFQVPLGAALVSARGYAAPEVGPVYERALALAQQIGDARRRFHVLYGLWGWHLVRDELDYSLQLSNDAMASARALDDPGILMEAHHLPANTLYYLGDFLGARDACRDGFALYDKERCQHHARITGQNSGVTLQCYWALALWNLGYPEQALARSRQALALADQLAHPFSQCYALHFAAWLHQYARLGPETQKLAEAERNLATEQGFAFWKATATLFRAAGLALQGKTQEARADADQGLAAFRATGAALSLTYYLSFLAQAQCQAGQLDDALRTLDEAIAIVDRTHDRYYAAELHRLQGEILERRGDQDAAERCYQRSLETARGQQARSWELRTAVSLARLWNRQGRGDPARRLLVDCYGWFKEGFALPDLVEARDLLKELA